MDVAGFVIGLAPLVTLARSVKSHIHHLRHNNAFKESLEERANQLYDAFRSVPETVSDEARRSLIGFIWNDLNALAQSLESVVTSQSRSSCLIQVKSCINASSYHTELQTCQTMLDSITRQVTAFVSEQRRIHDTPTIGNDKAEGPISDAGLDRALPVVEFLKRSTSQDLRVVCIHGLAGLGKSTLLKQVWNTDSNSAPFLARAMVQIGDNVTETTICRLQNHILRQLDWENKEFLSSDFGREELSKCFKELKSQSKPLFLAIDNVFSPRHLELLLPSRLAMADEPILPLKSCIALTSRNHEICKSLLRICGLKGDNELQVLCHMPPFLSDEAGMRIFVDCAGMQQDAVENQGLLAALVPLCKGLPLALTILGKVFRDETLRSSAKWQQIKKQMVTLEDDKNRTAPIREALQISYDLLSEPLQEAFLHMVEVFYGWPWEIVECIVGELYMGDLKDSSLISPVSFLSQCNQGAISERSESLMRYFDLIWDEGRVWMHDLVFAFGRSILDNNNIGYKRSINQVSILTTSASSVKILILKADANYRDLLSNLADLGNLEMLAVCPYSDAIFAVSSCAKTFSSQQGKGKLKYLMLGGVNGLDNLDLRAMVTPEIQGIHLVDCEGTFCIPDIFPLVELQVLHVRGCRGFQGFSDACVQGWHSLKELLLENCQEIIRIPDALASLSNLQIVRISNCPCLEKFPPLSSPCGPFELLLKDCPVLTQMGDLSCCLRKLHITGSDLLTELPCFRSPCLETLKELELSDLRQLQRLPGSICSMTALERLRLYGNESLLELPQNIGDLASLTLLWLWGCQKLQQLPDSICSLSALENLDLLRCESLVELPHNIGDSVAVKTLGLRGCKKLRELPGSICRMKALEDLSLSKCETLTELPHNIGDLASLKILSFRECKKLQRLPNSICGVKSLEELVLTGCESLMELPHNIGDLASLKELCLRGCKQLRQLPGSICSLKALQRLYLSGCENLLELPHNIGDLISMKKLWLTECNNLQQILGSVCSMKALEELDLSQCESLVELPHNIGDLAFLRVLELRDCKKLQQLPSCICSMKALEKLDLTGCESLVELPHNIGDLPSLKIIRLHLEYERLMRLDARVFK